MASAPWWPCSPSSLEELDVVGRWPHGSVAMVSMHVPWELMSLGNLRAQA